MDTNFSTWLIEKMREHDWSQADLARASGLTRQSISYYLSEKSKQPDEFALQKIAKSFKIPPEEVYRAAGIMPPVPAETKLTHQIMHITTQLPPEEQQGILEFAKLRLRLSEQRGKYETRKIAKNAGSSK